MKSLERSCQNYLLLLNDLIFPQSLRLEDVGACHFPSGKDEEEDLDASLEIRRVEIDLRYCAGDAFKRAVPAISGLTSLEFKEVDFVDDDLLDPTMMQRPLHGLT
jgi:hypothetical protein